MESGEKFWTGAKRFPRSAELDASAEQHAAFVLSTANLLAAGYGVSPQEKGLLPLDHPQRDPERKRRTLATVVAAAAAAVAVGVVGWLKLW